MKAYTSKAIKKKCSRFVSEYKIKELTTNFLIDIIKSQGYKIIRFSPFYNDEDVESLIECLGIQEYIKSRPAFIYQDAEHRILFLQEDLSDKEYLILLAHEEGHIYLGHIKNKMIIGQSVNDEYEANEFAHYLINATPLSAIKNFVQRKRKYIISIAAVITVTLIGFGVYNHLNKTEDIAMDYYVIETGSKYHLRDCGVIKNRTDVRKATQKEIDEHEYLPCKICLPGLQ